MSKIFILTAVAVLFITPTWGLSVSDINSGTYWVNPEEAGFDDCLDLNYETGESYGSYVPSSTCRSNWSKWIKERTQYSSLTGNGSITYYWPILKVECPINDEIHCETTYDRTNSEAAITVCASGYYGNGKTCTKCPANASCSGEGNTTFTCNSGYCNTGTACVARPANSTCSGTTFKCNAGYYKSGSLCKKCPNGGTSVAGATAQSQCFVHSGTSQSDIIGSYQYTLNCYYN